MGRSEPPADEVHWFCPVCRDGGTIVGWREARWDLTKDLQSGQIVSLFQHRAHCSRQVVSDQAVTVLDLEAELIGGPIQLERPVSRRLRISADKTLHDLHELLRQAFGWTEDEPYDFMFGAPYEAGARRYTGGIDTSGDGEQDISETRSITLDGLRLARGQTFGYLFDFGEEWVHRLSVVGISETFRAVRPRVVERRGSPPPQHPDPEDLWEEDLVWTELDEDYPMTGLYGPYVAEETPDPEMWLAMDQLEQQLLVSEAHSQGLPQEHPGIDSAPLHALVHCLAETRLAQGDPALIAQLQSRLRERMSRHQAIHELGEQLVREALRTTTHGPSLTSRHRRRTKKRSS